MILKCCKPVKVLCQLKGHQSVLLVPDCDFIQDAPLFVSWTQNDQQLIGHLFRLHRGAQHPDRNINNKMSAHNLTMLTMFTFLL